MAAGNTLLVKLRYRSRPSTNSAISPNIEPNEPDIRHFQYAMPSTPELELDHEHSFDDHREPVLNMHLPPPIDPLDATSFEHGSAVALSVPSAPMMPLTTAAILSQRKRRRSTASLKRSASTPNVRGHHSHSSDVGMTLAEKRRNKLGYHRTSVACGHCRRRKIRCLAAPDDPQGRCANCIRLKKECIFLPVEQQPPMERRPRAGSKADMGGSSSSESSPMLHGGHMFTQVEPFSSYSSSLPLSTPEYPSSSTAMSAGLVSPLTRVPEQMRAFEFPHQQRTSWGSPFPDNGPISAGYSSPGDPPPHTLWGRHSDSPVTPGFSPHMSGVPTSSMHSFSDSRSSFTSFAPSRNDSGGFQNHIPARSMSYGLLEGLPINGGYDNGYYSPQPLTKDIRRRASDMRPPSLQTSACSSSTSISEAHLTPHTTAPHSAPANSPPVNQWQSLPTSYSAFPGTSLSKGHYDGSWYSDTTPLAKVQEEEISPHFGAEPTILYAGDHN